jgi:hypothetical protein
MVYFISYYKTFIATYPSPQLVVGIRIFSIILPRQRSMD